MKPAAARWIAAGAVVFAFLVFDFFTPRWIRDDWIAWVLVGICIGQVNLIAAWAALAPGNVVLRLPWSLLLGMFMWYALVLGNRASNHLTPEGAAILGIVVLGGLAVLQIPLWIAGRAFRWRLVASADAASKPSAGPLQFELWQMMLGVLFVSIALAPARAVLPPGNLDDLRLNGALRELIVVLTAATLCNLVVTVLCIWGAFLPQRRFFRLAFAWLFHCAAVTGVGFFGLVAVLGSPGPESTKVAMSMYLLNVSQCAAVFGTLRIFRAVGFRLVRV